MGSQIYGRLQQDLLRLLYQNQTARWLARNREKTTISPDHLITQCSSWDQFLDRTRNLTKKQKGAAFERLTQLYLQTDPTYQSKLDKVWLLPEVPTDVRDYLNLPKNDEGIDLIAKTIGGEYWAIQAKYRRNRDAALDRTELGTFIGLAFNTCQHIELAVVAHSRSWPIGKKDLYRNTIEIGLSRWESCDWELIVAGSKGESVCPVAYIPKPHQIQAIDRSAALLRAECARPPDHAVRHGKSLTGYWIASGLKAKAIIVAVPSLALIQQCVADWTREFLADGQRPEWLCVCSMTPEDTMSRIEQDEFAHSVYETGLPTHTDPKEIAAWLAVPSDNPKIIFTTYHSSDQLAAGARLAGVEFDLALLDEAHKTVGNRSKVYATLLSDEKIKIRRRMFMTATERVFRGDNDDVLCMDSEADYGKCFFRMSFKDAIAEDIITDYKIVTVTVSQQHVRQLIADNRILNLSDDFDEAEAQRLATGIAVKNAFRDYGIKHGIGFCRSIKAADQLRGQQDLLNDVSGLGPEIENFQISSKKSQGQRSDTLKQFRAAERGFITNARCLTEGVDVPAIDCVAFADPKQSTIDIVQAAGRALRKFEDKITGYTKTCGYILLPIVVPDGMDFVEFAETTAFRNIVRTIAALSTQDERIAEQFRAVENGHVSKGKIVEITGDVPVGMRMDLKEFTDAISTRIWESVGRVSWRPFEEAREFVWGLGFKLQSEYRAYYKSGNKPADIPSAPDKIYANRGWINWGDWLGTSKPWRPFEGARTFAHGLKLESSQEWFAYCRSSKKPADIPVHPERAYADSGWISWGDFLGNGNVTNISWRPFEESRAFVHALGFKSQKEYRAYCRSGNKPADIPSNPQTTYADSGWIGWGDFLGNDNPRLPLKDARALEEGPLA